MNSNQRLRSRLILFLILIGAGFLISALYYIQIMNGRTYSAKADQQYVKPKTAIFDRGSIYFQSKSGTRVAAATLGSGFSIYMNPTQIKDSSQVYEALSQYLKINKTDFMEKARKTNDKFEIISQKIDSETGKSIGSLQIPGIGIMPENWRVYPGATLTAHVLGLIGQNENSAVPVGRYGLERSYESVLARSGSGSANVFAQLFGATNFTFDSEQKEGDIVTTIEPTVQKYLEDVLQKTESSWKSDEIGGIIIDPQNGNIIAISSLPTFDPNSTAGVKNISIFSNPMVEHVYEMGSILKPLTMAVALDTGAVTANSTYSDTGTMTLNGKKISNFDGVARGITSMQEILSQSLNVGAATIALKVGKDELSRYFLNFGLGEKSGIDAPNEATGIVGNLKTGRDIEIATAAYGQGIAVSPVSIVRALSVLANGGYVVKPHLVKEIDYSDGTVKKISEEKNGPVLKKQTVEEVTRMLVKVVDEKISAAHPDIRWQNYSIAAKTGTAQIPDHSKGGYYSDRYLHSFFGYFPAYKAKFLVFLYQVHPKGAQYASETLTEPFSQITKFLINYYNIAPDR